MSQRLRAFVRAGVARALVITALGAIGLCLSAFGQNSGSLRGEVMDPQGAAIINATVTLVNSATRVERRFTTIEGGQYDFPQVPPGTYSVTIMAKGFETLERSDIELLVSTSSILDFKLNIGTQTSVVEVSGKAETVNNTDASLGVPFDTHQIEQLPLDARNVPDLLSLQTGVVYTSNRSDINLDRDTRSGAVNGARSDQSNITLDGVDVNDQVKGYAFTSVLPVTPDSVDQFRVTTTNYGADQGRSSGAQVALVTKSGTNQFHGALYEYNRNTATSANDYFVKLAELHDGEPNQAPKLIRNNFGVALGGPILHDRLFFFTNYEGARQREEESVVRTIPTATLRGGTLEYPNVNGGTTILDAQQITALDPLHLGPDPG